MEFRMLGPLEVRSGGETLALGGAKQRALLAILLLQPNHVVSRERLAELLWGDEPPPTADHVIEVYVSQLRRALEPGGAPYKLLVRKPAGYVLQVPASDLDTTQFASLVEGAKTCGPAEAVAHLQRALEMWRGPALADFAGESFAVSEAARLNELRLYAIEERIEAELKLGHHGRLIGELQGLVEQHPLRERLCGLLMLALYRSGRQAEASDVYQKTRERLVDELGMEPGPELQDLLKRILQQESGLAAAEVAAPSLPSGMVTFLLTDVEGSTRRWDRNPSAMQTAMEVHDTVLGRVIHAHGGMQVESGREGDSILAAFRRATDALACAVEIQKSLAVEKWPEGADLHIRVAIHTGEAELRGGHYFGPAVYRCARLLATGHGDQLLLTQATHDVVVDTLRGDVALRDLGMHRLRDLERPERIFQVTGPGLRSEFPPLNSLDPRRHNLPISPTRFIGREKELADIADRLAAHRMLTLAGPGGTGKTRLALQAAAENIDRFADGVWCVELASVREPELVTQTVAEALGVREEPGRPLIKSVVDRWRERKFLLVLDNCEHLIAAAVKLADELLRTCADVRILTTSREALRVNGEAIMRVGPLAESDAVTLFGERSAAVESDFRVTAENEPVIAQICRRVEDIPLAVELAAGRARMMNPVEILTRLQESFGVLAGGSRSSEGRHETLSTAIDWSYWLLSEDEQRLLRSLSVFFGGFTLEAAEAVFSESEKPTLELLGQLVDKSLVAPHLMADGSTRYALLETVRDYGHQKLRENEEHEEIHARHGVFFAGLIEASRGKLNGPSRKLWLQRLTNDIDNCRALFELREVDPAAILGAAAALGDFWEARGEYTEGRSRLENALSSSFPAPPAIRADALQAAGLVAWAQGDQDAATKYTNDALELTRQIGDTLEEALCLQQLGQLASQIDEFDAARDYVNQALEIATANGYEQIQAVCEWRLGFIAVFTHNLEPAIAHYQRAIELASDIRDGEMVATSHGMLGHIAIRRNRLDEAKSHLRASLEFYRGEGSLRSIANLLEDLADVALTEGAKDRALTLAGAAEGLRSRIGVVPTSPVHRAFMERVDPLRQSLEGERSWQLGRAMSRDEAIACAFDDLTATATSAQA
ncbi:MAG TPA: BTAD domain-containing putative transcriptional regulator [Candidatus Dormibacteraeota bacterium]|nr:BTAD domain-containing putative transcriptional regulator [Candidatus Dormibacteraeota bacterium]